MRLPLLSTVLLVLLAASLAGAGAASAALGPCLPGHPAVRCHVWTGQVTFVDDGDTLDVDVAGDGQGPLRRVRMTGVQAMELTRYSKYASRRRGECHGVDAADRVDHLVRRAHGHVRLAAQDPASHSGVRHRRLIAVRLHHRWVDLGTVLLREGRALWLPNGSEWSANATYRRLSERARARELRLWDPRGCGAGPQADIGPTLTLNYDADGADFDNVDGEWARIGNPGGAALDLAGWWFRDSALRRYTFPAGAQVPPHGTVTLFMGRGASGGDRFFWGLPTPPFENPTYDVRAIGDGGYLFDPRGNLRASEIYPA
ncbi:MAG TPA: lamin tail domain-containing protein [Baekduia sp.]|nr:lamin tail domain-containing protein [Baekduia sp.]